MYKIFPIGATAIVLSGALFLVSGTWSERSNAADKISATNQVAPAPESDSMQIKSIAGEGVLVSVKRRVIGTPGVFQVPIKRRAGGTAVIDVIFNGNKTFEMILDTGASSSVITQQMAGVLGVVPDGQITASTPSHQAAIFKVGKVKSIQVGNATMNNVRVAIAPQLDIGLLGQDFFSHYDVTVKQNVVEFHAR